jgi:hypothetical protein
MWRVLGEITRFTWGRRARHMMGSDVIESVLY